MYRAIGGWGGRSKVGIVELRRCGFEIEKLPNRGEDVMDIYRSSIFSLLHQTPKHMILDRSQSLEA